MLVETRLYLCSSAMLSSNSCNGVVSLTMTKGDWLLAFTPLQGERVPEDEWLDLYVLTDMEPTWRLLLAHNELDLYGSLYVLISLSTNPSNASVSCDMTGLPRASTCYTYLVSGGHWLGGVFHTSAGVVDVTLPAALGVDAAAPTGQPPPLPSGTAVPVFPSVMGATLLYSAIVAIAAIAWRKWQLTNANSPKTCG